ncbi:DUF4202 domain-containing protein [Thalassotalea euphylliae]|uniref:DUF4202 domain-containing protein n=1 Tax=Thalassotalea euphylliae TaxID=1655234 RepID=A0A3E0UCB6_9GAMM|nr:DUF4202 domain-containing protein [Thalassotalea euphylliae]REL34529.1 DUF4202 domain-containing protein [Thalassotalea euphylliae]
MSAALNLVLDAIDAINQQDPNVEQIDGQPQPKELVYGQRMSQCLHSFWPDSSEHLQIAVRAQHVKRWAIARSEYPEGKAGYLKWRKALGQLHAETASELMLANGYAPADADRTAAIIRKEKLKSNPESQTLEDVACLVFLSYYFAPFAAKHSDEKIISILQKTWKKMSATAQQIALKADLPAHLAALVEQALAEI